ncbi:hypothetical protein PQR36_29020 [Paraburkholderia nemoris]|uniref:hypothetical protein n=1 Tax=Paraburkholderia nemoris TaxID=2793076 RepID=UPI0038BC288D
MTRFITRIELHDANSDDYERLHEEMEKRKFYRTIKAEGVLYQLPDATYRYDGDVTANEVHDKAREAVKATRLKGGIIITESAGSVVSGLKRA